MNIYLAIIIIQSLIIFTVILLKLIAMYNENKRVKNILKFMNNKINNKNTYNVTKCLSILELNRKECLKNGK